MGLMTGIQKPSIPSIDDLISLSKDFPLCQNLNNFKYLGNPIVTEQGAGYWDNNIHHCRIYCNQYWTHPWRIYYAGANNSGYYTIGYVEADYAIGPYTQYASNPIIVADQAWELDNYVAGFSMIQIAKNSFVAYYQYTKVSGSELGIARCVSTDGTTWTGKQEVLSRYPQIGNESNGVAIPVPFYDVAIGKYYMICDGLAPFTDITYAFYEFPIISESADGITWTKKKVLSLYGAGASVGPAPDTFAPNSIIKIGSVYCLLGQWHYQGSDTWHHSVVGAIANDILGPWYQLPKPLIWNSQTDEGVDTGRYPSVCFVDKTLYVIYMYQDGSAVYKIGLIQLPMFGPYTTEILDKATILATASATTQTLQLDGQKVNITGECTFHASATGDVTMSLYTSVDGTNWDTVVAETATTITCVAGATARKSFTPGDAAQRARFLKIVLNNADATYAITAAKITAVLGD